jgi:hypothetical protein
LPNPSATAARVRLSLSLQSAVIGDVFRKQYLHIIADPVAKVIADSTYYVESLEKGIALVARQDSRRFQRLLIHAHQRGKKRAVFKTNVRVRRRNNPCRASALPVRQK